MKCPVCAREVSNLACQCGADLTCYAHIAAMPDILYNEALSCYKRRDFSGAVQRLSAANALNPRDVDALKLWSICLYELRDLDGALSRAMDAQELSPSDGELDIWVDELAAETTDRRRCIANDLGAHLVRVVEELFEERAKEK